MLWPRRTTKPKVDVVQMWFAAFVFVWYKKRTSREATVRVSSSNLSVSVAMPEIASEPLQTSSLPITPTRPRVTSSARRLQPRISPLSLSRAISEIEERLPSSLTITNELARLDRYGDVDGIADEVADPREVLLENQVARSIKKAQRQKILKGWNARDQRRIQSLSNGKGKEKVSKAQVVWLAMRLIFLRTLKRTLHRQGKGTPFAYTRRGGRSLSWKKRRRRIRLSNGGASVTCHGRRLTSHPIALANQQSRLRASRLRSKACRFSC